MVSYPKVIIYTDGSCLGNPGAGGYCALMFVKHNGKVMSRKIVGGEDDTTNNRMELTAVCTALEALKTCCDVQFYLDSEYVEKNYINAPHWKLKGWKHNSGPVKNADLWERFLNAVNQTRSIITVNHVDAHTGIKYNEQCDTLARAEASRRKQALSR